MRGSFNTTCDLYFGYMSPFGAPGTRYNFNLPCRFVKQTLILQQDFPLTLTDHWLTIGATSLNVPQYHSYAVGQWWANIYTGDMVAIPTGDPPSLCVLREEFMHGPAQPTYWRYALVPLVSVNPLSWLPPDPPVTSFPGLNCGTAGQLQAALPGAWPIAPGQPQWWTFNAIMGTHYTVNVGGTAGATFKTTVLSGGCGLLMPYQGPLVGNGALAWMEGLGQIVWVKVESTVPDSYTINVTIP